MLSDTGFDFWMVLREAKSWTPLIFVGPVKLGLFHKICEMLEDLPVAHETSEIKNKAAFGVSVCNIYVCFYKPL